MQFNFRTRLVVFFVALLVSVQIITFTSVYTVTHRNVLNQISDQLSYASDIFYKRIEARTQGLIDAAHFLAADFGFKRAIASKDEPTVLSALANLKTRIKADRVMLIAPDGSIISNSGSIEMVFESFPYPAMFEMAEENDEASSIIILNDTIHEFIIVPVLAPEPIAWLGLGFVIDDALAADFKARSPLDLDISFAYQHHNGYWQNNASTLNAEAQKVLPEFLIGNSGDTLGTVQVNIAGEDYVVLAQQLKTPAGSQNVAAVLQYPLDTALAPYHELIWWLSLLMAIGLVFSVFGGVLIARGVTRPVKQLADAAHRIHQGDYQEPVKVTGKDELGELAETFNYMMTGISERERKISYQACHDVSTGLPNRAQFEMWLDEAITQAKTNGRPFAVALIGIQRFTEINCTLGHDVGDDLIREIGARFDNLTKQHDTTARLNSDVFCLLLPDATEANSPDIAKRLLKVFDEPILVEGANVDISAVIGITCYPVHATDAKGLMQRADAAMFIASETDHLYAVYDEEKDPYSAERLSLMGELYHGIVNNELELYYQPQIDVATGRISHVEALIRWNHPTKGFMPPDVFIPLAEQTGNIRKLTEWVLDTAIKQCSEWRKSGIELHVAINLSAKDLLNKDLSLIIAHCLKKYAVDSSWLVLEITESAIMHDADRSLDMLQVLHSMGLMLSIDDFGTGYSSMEYLKKLPVNELKVDRSFITELASNKEDQIIVKSAIDLGHNLGMSIVAEGIEDEASLKILQEQNCDLVQGYFFSPPLPVDKLMDWVNSSPWGLSRNND